MKIPKEAKERIERKLRRKAGVKRSEIVRLLLLYGEPTDAKTLLERDLNRTAQRLVASIRDVHGDREVLAIAQRAGDVEYALISKTEDLDKLSVTHDRLTKRSIGIKATAAKVLWRIRYLSRQIGEKEYRKGLKERTYLEEQRRKGRTA